MLKCRRCGKEIVGVPGNIPDDVDEDVCRCKKRDPNETPRRPVKKLDDIDVVNGNDS